MANVWGYWECPNCSTLIRGDNRTCPNCGSPIPNGVKYLPPDHPKVREAIGRGRCVDEYKEYVPEDKESARPNWTCEYCGYQNKDESKFCEGCGSPRYESKGDYFGNDVKLSEAEKTEKSYTTTDYDPNKKKASRPSAPVKKPGPNKKFLTRLALILGALAFIIWLFYPVKKTFTVKGFSWERNISVEEYTLCHEDDWSVPAGGTVTSKRQEIHHYNHVIDHYETRSREVPKQVFDGYDTSYSDNGNGQFTEVQTPRYRTEYETEYYDEPVYRDDPVYQTKYYYDIDRWLEISPLTTSGSDHDPFWADTDLPNEVSSPKYGDRRQAGRTETYNVIAETKKGKEKTFEYSLDEWESLKIGDKIEQEGLRFE